MGINGDLVAGMDIIDLLHKHSISDLSDEKTWSSSGKFGKFVIIQEPHLAVISKNSGFIPRSSDGISSLVNDFGINRQLLECCCFVGSFSGIVLFTPNRKNRTKYRFWDYFVCSGLLSRKTQSICSIQYAQDPCLGMQKFLLKHGTIWIGWRGRETP